jgi:hypothetical protein
VNAQAPQFQVPDAERASYAGALAYCRGLTVRETKLRDDKRVLCLDGPINVPRDFIVTQDLEQGGILVVRSHGIANNVQLKATITLAEKLREKNATVVIRDYCLGICANYLFMASVKTFVPGGALVAWSNHPTGPDNCIDFYPAKDSDVPFLGQYPCDKEVDPDTWEVIQFKINFYELRTTLMVEPPESITIRKELKRRFDATGKYPMDVDWTWNPRFYPGMIPTKVVYESYPKSQEEVDAIVARLGLTRPVIYDP